MRKLPKRKMEEERIHEIWEEEEQLIPERRTMKITKTQKFKTSFMVLLFSGFSCFLFLILFSGEIDQFLSNRSPPLAHFFFFFLIMNLHLFFLLVFFFLIYFLFQHKEKNVAEMVGCVWIGRKFFKFRFTVFFLGYFNI